jgi:hypothetical protein
MENKQLNKAYAKRFEILNKDFFTDTKTGLVLFVEYLKYLRDVAIISIADDKNNIALLNATVAEFYALAASSEEASKDFHWNNFWELIRLYMKEWLELNDSI